MKLPGSKTADCYGQLDLYFGSKIYDGGAGDNHGPLPNFDKGDVSPPSGDLIGAWNGGTAVCDTTPPTTTPPTTTPSSHPSSHPSSPPASAPSTPSSPPTTTAVKPTSSAPTTPAPSTPGTTAPSSTPSSPSTPTLAHTGSNAGAISLVALAFFGAGGTAMMAARKAAARKH